MAKQNVPLKLDPDLKDWLSKLPNKNQFIEQAIKEAKDKHENKEQPFTSKKEYNQ